MILRVIARPTPAPPPYCSAFVQAVEHLEDQLLVGLRDADAVVADVVARRMARLDADLDPSRGLVVVLDRVADQIGEYLADPLALQVAVPNGSGRRISIFSSAIWRLKGSSASSTMASRSSVCSAQLGSAGLRLLEQGVDKTVHPLRQLQDGRDLLLAFLVEHVAVSPSQSRREVVDAPEMFLQLVGRRVRIVAEFGRATAELAADPFNLGRRARQRCRRSPRRAGRPRPSRRPARGPSGS